MVSNQSDGMVSGSLPLKVSGHITSTIWASIDEDADDHDTLPIDRKMMKDGHRYYVCNRKALRHLTSIWTSEDASIYRPIGPASER